MNTNSNRYRRQPEVVRSLLAGLPGLLGMDIGKQHTVSYLEPLWRPDDEDQTSCRDSL